MRISYWSSDVCSSDLSFATGVQTRHLDGDAGDPGPALRSDQGRGSGRGLSPTADVTPMAVVPPTAVVTGPTSGQSAPEREQGAAPRRHRRRSEEHTSELQSLMRISYAVFCLKKEKIY